METIYKSALKLMAPLTLEEVCQRSVEEGCKLIDAEFGSIFWHENGKLKRVYSNIPLKYQLEPRPKGNTLEVFKQQKPRFLSSKVMEKNHPRFKDLPIKSLNLIPLTYADKSLGVMTLQSFKDENMLKKRRQRVQLFSSMASLAIRNVQLFAQKEEALKQRDLFMSLASHELKTPIAVVIMTLHLIERKYKSGGKFDPKWIETIKRNTSKLKLLIDDLFSVSQIHAGTIRLRSKEFSIIETSQKIIGELSMVYSQSIKLKNELESEQEVMKADEEKVSLVLTNIITNAAKFSEPDSEITVRLVPKWSGIEIQVKDRGVGIDPADQKRVFERYFQGKNRRNGLGLGLFLSRQIIEAHDGEISLTSTKGKGTTIKMWLPRS